MRSLTPDFIKYLTGLSKDILNSNIKRSSLVLSKNALTSNQVSSMFLGYLASKFTYTLFHTKTALLTSNNVIFNTNTHTHFFTLFSRRRPPKNRYTRKQPTHFSMTP